MKGAIRSNAAFKAKIGPDGLAMAGDKLPVGP